jgi:hypothetical protein
MPIKAPEYAPGFAMNDSAQLAFASLPPGSTSSSTRLEKRGAGRIPARSQIELRYGRKLGARRRAELLNVGRGGFRARHCDARIHADKLVAFRHQFADGFARVTWTKPDGEWFESGFEIVQKPL